MEQTRKLGVTCCKDCKLRSENCHSRCSTYKEAKARHDKAKKEYQRLQEVERIANCRRI